MHSVEISDFRSLKNNSVRVLRLFIFIFIICHSFYRDHQKNPDYFNDGRLFERERSQE